VATVDAAVETGDQACVAAYACERYRLQRRGKTLGGACIADAGSIRFGPTLLALYRLVATVYTALGDAGGGILADTALGAPFLPEHLLTGLPVALELTDDEGRTLRGLQLLSVMRVQLQPGRLALPTERDADG